MQKYLKIDVPETMILPLTTRVDDCGGKYFESTKTNVELMNIHCSKIIFYVSMNKDCRDKYNNFDTVTSLLDHKYLVSSICFNFNYKDTDVKVICFNESENLFTYTIHTDKDYDFEAEVETLFKEFIHVWYDTTWQFVPYNSINRKDDC